MRWVDSDARVTPVAVVRIGQEIDDAELAGDEVVVFRLDTPGGRSDSRQGAVSRVLASKVPIVAWVGPAEGQAAARELSHDPAAMQLRYLQTLTDLASERSSTIAFLLPIELLRSIAR